MDKTKLMELAKKNAVNLDQLEELDRRLAELARAGLVQPRGYSLPPPLSRPEPLEASHPFSNAATLFTVR